MPRHRAGLASSFFLYAVAITVDIVEIILDFFVVGAIVNRILDIAMAIFLFFVFLVLRILDERASLILFAALIGEEIPGLDAAPLWTLDVWYTIQRAHRQDKEAAAQAEANEQADLETQRAYRAMFNQVPMSRPPQNPSLPGRPPTPISNTGRGRVPIAPSATPKPVAPKIPIPKK